MKSISLRPQEDLGRNARPPGMTILENKTYFILYYLNFYIRCCPMLLCYYEYEHYAIQQTKNHIMEQRLLGPRPGTFSLLYVALFKVALYFDFEL